MPLENLEEQGLEKNPNLEIARDKFILLLDAVKKSQPNSRLMEAIVKNGMTNGFFTLFLTLLMVYFCRYGSVLLQMLRRSRLGYRQ